MNPILSENTLQDLQDNLLADIEAMRKNMRASEAYELIVFDAGQELARHRLTQSNFTLTQAMRDDFSGQTWRVQVAQINTSGLPGAPCHLEISAL